MATHTINDLYLKYANKVGRALENDGYFQYLFEMVQAGENVLEQNNQILHKVVDERWLSTIEESLDAINTIIDKPRRFIATNEEVVPVALAKKITADSVRHLSQNTQFIASNEDGDIQPTRVLNISTEESYDLYENRFVYHLIQRLVTFIDKRTDIIFWATGDETQNVLSYTSKVDDAYEQIEYKIEMKVKNIQSFAENDTDNMSVFMRIDRVRRMVMSLKNSSFCDLMAGCAKVRSPIQRTNLIMKEPNYRTCYKLWQFLESYDEVGYTIEVENNALQFDEEYLIQMYTNLITNYTVFKSLLEDERRIELGKKRRAIKPKFIKKVKEQIVEDRNIEDVEIRQVFIEEVTEAQLEAEAKLAEETEARKQAEEALEEMDSQMVFLQQQISTLMMSNQEAEVRAEEERQAKEAAIAENEAVRLEAEEARKEAETARLETETARQETQDARSEAEAARQETEAAKLEVERAKKDVELARQEIETVARERELAKQETIEVRQQAGALMKEQIRLEAQKQEAQSRLVLQQEEADAKLADLQSRHEESLELFRKEALETQERLVKEAKDKAALILRETKERSAQTLKETKEQARKELEEASHKAERTLKASQEKAQKEYALLRQEKEAQAIQAATEKEKLSQILRDTRQNLEESSRKARDEEELRKHLEEKLAQANEAWERLEKKLSETENELMLAKEQAQAEKLRADANTLSHYILSALQNRKGKASKTEEADNTDNTENTD